MSNFFIRIYDYLSRHRALAIALALVLTATFVFLASRIHYEEDIAAFLPQDGRSAKLEKIYSHIGDQGQIVVIFHNEKGDVDSIISAIDDFGSRMEEADSSGRFTEIRTSTDEDQVLEVMEYALDNASYFLNDSDYGRMDSLLAQPNYIERTVSQDKNLLLFPTGGIMDRTLQNDPLHLFTPLLNRLQGFNASGSYKTIDGYVFTADEKRGLAFLSSPYGMSESGENGKLDKMLSRVITETGKSHPEVEISSIGAPIIAVGNATQIKKDSFIAIIIAVLLILAILLYSFRRLDDLVWMVCSIGFGLLFALGGLALYHDNISIIVLGIGSILIGIAANYPIHYLDYLNQKGDRRQALIDNIEPLIVGNLTSVGAFLSLVFLKAPAMRDLGAFGGFVLIGTILFVIVFLPVFVRVKKSGSSGTYEGRMAFRRLANLDIERKGWISIAMVLLTVLFIFTGRNAKFDGDMNHINYMTAKQKEDMQWLTNSTQRKGMEQVFAVAHGSSLDEALAGNEALLKKLSTSSDTGLVKGVSGIGDFLPSKAEQQRRIGLWNSFIERHRTQIEKDLPGAMQAAGFQSDAFDSFKSLLEKDFKVREPDSFTSISGTLAKNYLWTDADGTSYVNNYVYVPSGKAKELKDKLPEDGHSYIFEAGDVGNQLVKVLSDSFNYIGTVCSLIVLLFLCISFGSVEIGLLSFIPLAISWIWILGMMGIFGLQFNIVNVILATFIFGQGDDYTIFISEGLIHEYTYGRKQLASYKNGIILSALIMFVGIGALVVSRHPAMRSLGEVTIIGMVTVVLMAYYLPPLIFRWLTEKRGRKRDVPVTLWRLGASALAMTFYIIAALLLLPVTAVYMLFGSRNDKWKLSYHRIICNASRFIVHHIPGAPFTYGNASGEDFSRPAVLICNHQSHFDLMCTLMLSPKMVVLTNDWAWNNPFYKFIVHYCDFYTVSNGVDKCVEYLRPLVEKGYSVIVFPEGTRSADCRVQRFHHGAFYIAEQLGLDIVPLYIHGTGHSLPKNDFMLRKARIHFEVGKRIEAGDSSFGIGYRERTRNIEHFYMAHYAGLCESLETADYWRWYVRHKYVYKEKSVEAGARKCVDRLVRSNAVSRLPKGSVCRLTNAGQGEAAWLYALTNPTVRFYAFEEDESLFQIASNTSFIPNNLHFISKDAEEIPDAECSIDLKATL